MHKAQQNLSFSRTSVLVVVLMLASIFAPFVNNPAAAEGGGGDYPYSGGDWLIDSETYVYNETIVLNGNLVIQNGGKLTLRGAEIKMDVSFNGEYYIEVQSGGELYVDDWDNDPDTTDDRTLITDGDDDDDAAAYNTAGNSRFAVRVRNGATFHMTNSELRESGYGSGDKAGINLDGRADYLFEDNFITKCYRGLQLVYSYGPGKGVRNNTFDACEGAGIIFYYSHNTTLEDNEFYNCPNQGLYLYSHPTNPAYYTSDNIIRNNYFQGNNYGSYLYGANCYRNEFYGNEHVNDRYSIAIATNSHNNTFRDIKLKDSRSYGLYTTTRSVNNIFRDLEISNSNYAVAVAGNSYNNWVVDSTLTGSTNADVLVDEGSNITLLNTPFSSHVMSAGGYLTEMQYLDIELEDFRGDPVQGADLRIVSRETGYPEGLEDNLVDSRHGTDVSSNSEYNWRFLAERVQDGRGEDGSNQDYYWLTKDNPGNDKHLTLDFSEEKTFDFIRMLNVRNAGYYDRSTEDFRLGISDNGVDFTIVHTGTLTENDIDTWYDVELDEPKTGRYLRFFLDSYHGAGGGLGELEVYNTGRTTKNFEFLLYATEGYGGVDKQTNGAGKLNNIPVIHRRWYNHDLTEYVFETDIDIKYHGWEDASYDQVISQKTEFQFTKDILTVGATDRDFTTIQDAVNYANLERKIKVYPGTYTENVVINDKNLHIYSATSDDHSDTTLDASGGVGFTASGSNPVHLDGFVVNNAATGVATQDDSKIYANLSFQSTTAPFSLGVGAVAVVMNSVFDKDDVIYGDNTATLYEGNSLRIVVEDRLDQPVESVFIQLKDSKDDNVGNSTTGNDGNSGYFDLLYRVLKQGSEDMRSPHTIEISKGEGATDTTITMNQSRVLTMTWFDPSRFGETVSVGDFDGDDIDDYAVGAPGYDHGGNNTGAVFLYRGGDHLVIDDLTLDNYDFAIYGERAGDMFGQGLAMNGDMNGDGLDDLVVGAPYTNLSEPYGINARYYHSQDDDKFADLVLEQREYMINYNWNNQAPQPGVNDDDFAVRWDGYLYIEEAGDYTFYLQHDDGGRFYLNEELLIDVWEYNEDEDSTDPIHLEPGYYPFLIETYDTGGPARLQFRWSSETFEKYAVPTESFRYTLERGPGIGGVYLVGGKGLSQYTQREVGNGENGLEPLLRELEVRDLSTAFFQEYFGIEDYGKSLNFLGDLNDDGFDEVGLQATRTGYDDRDRLYVLQGTPLVRYHEFKKLISALPGEGDYKDVEQVFDPMEWSTPIIGGDGNFTISDGGYLEIDTSVQMNDYAYVVSNKGIDSGFEMSMMFQRRGGMEQFQAMSIMNYSIPAEDTGDNQKQWDSTLFSVFTNGRVLITPSPGEQAQEFSLPGVQGFPTVTVSISPEHDNITVYINTVQIAAMDISGWEDELFVVVGDTRSNANQGGATIALLTPGPYVEALNTAGPMLSFNGGNVLDSDGDELLVSATNTLLFGNEGNRIFPTLENDTILLHEGNFSDTAYGNGTFSIAYGSENILANSDFDNGWDNWTQTDNVREKNDGTWELTEEAHGDWHVYDGGPTMGLGPDRDNVASSSGNGRNCDGRLVSDPFYVPPGTTVLDLWHHAEWWSFEYADESQYQDEIPDFIAIRLVKEGTNDVVDEVVYTKDSDTGENSDGEEEGRIQLDISGVGGEMLRLEVVQVNNYRQYDDGIVQIDNIRALTAKDKGHFVSQNLSVEEGDLLAIIPQWSEARNDGTVTMKIRTDETDWESALEVENGELLRFPVPAEKFQYRFELERQADSASPSLRDIEFIYFTEDTIPLQFNTTGEYRSKLGTYSDDGRLDLLFNSQSQEEVLLFDGSTIQGKVDQGRNFIELDDYHLKINPGAGASESFGEQASFLTDLDEDGYAEILVADPDIDGAEIDTGALYVFYGSATEGTDYTLADTAFQFTGEERQGRFGSTLNSNLATLSFSANPRVEILPNFLIDLSIARFSIEDQSLVYPNTTLDFSMIAANIGFGDVAGDIDYYINITSLDESYTQGFSGTITDLDADQWVYLNHSWDVPEEEEILYYINITLVRGDDQYLNNNKKQVRTTSRFYKVGLVAGNGTDFKRVNEYLRYNITISNIGTLGRDEVYLGAQVPGNWDYFFRYEGSTVDRLNITDQGEKMVEFLVRSPTDATLEDWAYNFTLNVTSQNGISYHHLALEGYLVDVDILPVSINFFRRDGMRATVDRHIVNNEVSDLEIKLANQGNLSSGGFKVELYQDDDLIDTFDVEDMAGGERLVLSREITLFEGELNFRVVVDTQNQCFEYTETNNELEKELVVIDGTPNNEFTVFCTMYNLDQELVDGADLIVTVDGYSFEFTSVTDEKGEANLSLGIDDYYEGSRMKIEGVKGSKYTYVLDYAYSEDGETHITLVLMKYALNVKVDTLSRFIKLNPQKTAYETVDYHITITNSGVEDESYELYAEKPFGWQFEFLGNVSYIGAGKYSFELGPRSSGMVTLQITASDVMSSPLGKRSHAGDNVNVTFQVASVNAPFAIERTTITVVEPADNITTHAFNTDGKLYQEDGRFFKDLVPGEASDFSLNVRNFGNTHKSFFLTAEGENAEYARLSTDTLTLNCLDSAAYTADFIVTITVPDGLREDTELLVDVLLMDENNTFTETVKLGVRTLKKQDFTLELISASLQGGNLTLLEVKLQNPTADTIFVDFKDVFFVNSLYTGNFQFSLENVTLGAGEFVIFSLIVEQNNMDLTTLGEVVALRMYLELDNQTLLGRELRYTAQAYHAFKLSAEWTEAVLHQGEQYRYNLSLENLGNGAWDIAYFEIDDPAGWGQELDKIYLRNGENRSFTYLVVPSPDAGNGEYGNITITPYTTLGRALEPVTLVSRIDPYARRIDMGLFQYTLEENGINFTLSVVNSGLFSEKVRAVADLPTGNQYTIIPEEFTIGRSEIRELSLLVTEPGDDLDFGNYTITLYSAKGMIPFVSVPLPGFPVSGILMNQEESQYTFSVNSQGYGDMEYLWSVNDGAFPLSKEQETAEEISLDLSKSGEYLVRLRTTLDDPEMGKLSDSTSYLVTVVNRLPSLDSILEHYILEVNETLVLDTMALEDPDGAIMDIVFSFEGADIHATRFLVSFPQVGNNTITLTVVDNLGDQVVKEIRVEVLEPEKPVIVEEEKSDHMFTQIQFFGLLAVSLLFFFVAGILIPAGKQLEEEEPDLTLELHNMRSLKTTRNMEMDDLKKRREEEEKHRELMRTHTACPSCSAFVPKKMNFCNKCGKKMKVADVKTCPKCGVDAPSHVLFCLKCGNKFPSTLVDEKASARFIKRACPSCGHVLERGDTFCDMCGTKTKSDEDGSELLVLVKCPTCLRQVGKNLKFCTFCGEKLKDEDELPENKTSPEEDDDIIEVVDL